MADYAEVLNAATSWYSAHRRAMTPEEYRRLMACYPSEVVRAFEAHLATREGQAEFDRLMKVDPPQESKYGPSEKSALQFYQEYRRQVDASYSFTGGPVIRGVTSVRVAAKIGEQEIGHIDYAFNKQHRIGEIETVVALGSRGTGGQLVQYAESDMRANRITKVVLTSDFEQLGGAEGFWIKLGYNFQPNVPPNWKFMEKRLAGLSYIEYKD